jgi:hypothetical protein
MKAIQEWLERVDRNQEKPIIWKERAEQAEAKLFGLQKFHPRAMKLLLKAKNFIVIACDEPYFLDVYRIIRQHEMAKNTWSTQDENIYNQALERWRGIK